MGNMREEESRSKRGRVKDWRRKRKGADVKCCIGTGHKEREGGGDGWREGKRTTLTVLRDG